MCPHCSHPSAVEMKSPLQQPTLLSPPQKKPLENPGGCSQAPPSEWGGRNGVFSVGRKEQDAGWGHRTPWGGARRGRERRRSSAVEFGRGARRRQHAGDEVQGSLLGEQGHGELGGGRAGTGPRWNWRAHSWGGSPFLVKIGSKAVFMVLGCFY